MLTVVCFLFWKCIMLSIGCSILPFNIRFNLVWYIILPTSAISSMENISLSLSLSKYCRILHYVHIWLFVHWDFYMEFHHILGKCVALRLKHAFTYMWHGCLMEESEKKKKEKEKSSTNQIIIIIVLLYFFCSFGFLFICMEGSNIWENHNILWLYFSWCICHQLFSLYSQLVH